MAISSGRAAGRLRAHLDRGIIGKCGEKVSRAKGQGRRVTQCDVLEALIYSGLPCPTSDVRRGADPMPMGEIEIEGRPLSDNLNHKLIQAALINAIFSQQTAKAVLLLANGNYYLNTKL